MTKTFQFSSPPSVDEMLEFIQQMRDLLDALSHGEIPDEQYTIEDLNYYCQSLVNNQRGSLGRTKSGSWSVAETDVEMPADARVDFIFVPTYVAVATLTKVRVDYPTISAAIPGYDDALRRGMIFATHRRLEGHGYDATRGLIDAALIFAEGGVAEFLSSNPDFCPELLNILRELNRTLTDRISSGQTVGAWGEEYKEDFLSLVETLRLVSIPGMEASIKSGMEEPLEDSKRDIEW
jgi:hypothetical protein